MNKVLFGVITVVAVVCFCGLVPSAAADKMEVIMGESIFSEDNIDMPDDLDKADSAPTAVFSLNYLQDLYATTAPSSGENYNKSAVKAFSAGSTVYLITRFYLAFGGSLTIYYWISNAAGSVMFWTNSSGVLSSGSWINSKTISGLSAGVYVFTPLILAPGNYMIPQSGFTFVVE